MPTRNNLTALFFLCLMTTGTATATTPAIDNKPLTENRDPLTAEQKARIEVLENRVAQIRAMDQSKMSKSERKDLRREVREIKKRGKRDWWKNLCADAGRDRRGHFTAHPSVMSDE